MEFCSQKVVMGIRVSMFGSNLGASKLQGRAEPGFGISFEVKKKMILIWPENYAKVLPFFLLLVIL